MLNIPDHKGNVNRNYMKISPHSSQNSCHQEHKILYESVGGVGKELLFTW
jgi:hypothetical protein